MYGVVRSFFNRRYAVCLYHDMYGVRDMRKDQNEAYDRQV